MGGSVWADGTKVDLTKSVEAEFTPVGVVEVIPVAVVPVTSTVTPVQTTTGEQTEAAATNIVSQ